MLKLSREGIFFNGSSLIFQHGELHALHLVYNFKTPANMQGTKSEVIQLKLTLNLGLVTENKKCWVTILKFPFTAVPFFLLVQQQY